LRGKIATLGACHFLTAHGVGILGSAGLACQRKIRYQKGATKEKFSFLNARGSLRERYAPASQLNFYAIQ
jgi:hypothetical protein